MRFPRRFERYVSLLSFALLGTAITATSQSVPVQTTAAAASEAASKQQPSTDGTQTANISGTVTDTNGDVIPGAAVVLKDPSGPDRTAISDLNGLYSFAGLRPGIGYRVSISVQGFVPWTSTAIVLQSGEFHIVKEGQLAIAGGETSVTVSSSPVEIATEQIHVEEQQRVLGIVPNFYVVYDKNPAPLTTKLKFQLALRVSVDPMSFIGAGALAGMNQAGDTPNYPQGAWGYADRYGAAYADGITDLFIGGAILPSLLHQDPRYFYQGTGSKRSRALHAMAAPFVCKGDNGKTQFNFSSVGGDLFSSAISNVYYPPSNRGYSFVFDSFAIDTGERVVSTLIQEFLLRKLTPSNKHQNQ
jgi:Carboxypeptidase regulatory-like domain